MKNRKITIVKTQPQANTSKKAQVQVVIKSIMATYKKTLDALN